VPTGPWPAYSFAPPLNRPPVVRVAPSGSTRAPSPAEGLGCGPTSCPPSRFGIPLARIFEGDLMTRLSCTAVEQMMNQRPDATLEAALEVFEVFRADRSRTRCTSWTTSADKRIAIAPPALKEKYRRGEPWPSSSSRIRLAREAPRSHGARAAARVSLCEPELLLDAARRYGSPREAVAPRGVQAYALRALRHETRHHITVLQTTQFEFAENGQRPSSCAGGGSGCARRAARAARPARRTLRAPREAVDQRHRGDDGETPNQRAAADFVRSRRRRERRAACLPDNESTSRTPAVRAHHQHGEAPTRGRRGGSSSASCAV